MSKELSAAHRRKKNILAKQDINQEKLKSVEVKIRELEDNIARESEKLELEKKLAAQEYMDLRRSSLQHQIREYLMGGSGVLTRIGSNLASATEEVEHAFIALAMDRFTQALQQKLQWIGQMKREKNPKLLQQAINLGVICQQLQNILTEMERD